MSNSGAFSHIAQEAGMIITPLELARKRSPQDTVQSGLIGLPEPKDMAEQIMQVLGE